MSVILCIKDHILVKLLWILLFVFVFNYVIIMPPRETVHKLLFSEISSIDINIENMDKQHLESFLRSLQWGKENNANSDSNTIVTRMQEMLSGSEVFTDMYDACYMQYSKYRTLYPLEKHRDREYYTKSYVDKLMVVINNYKYQMHLESISASRINHSNFKMFPGVISFLYLHIHEQYSAFNNSSYDTAGGTGFRIMSYSKIITPCGYTDHFNGSYSVNCVISGDCSEIVVQLSHIQYNAYRGYSRSNDQIVLRKTVCVEHHYKRMTQNSEIRVHNGGVVSEQSGKSQTSIEDGVLRKISPHGVWIGTRENHTFISNDGFALALGRHFLCECFRRYHVTLIGASHMRNSYFCLLRMCKGQKAMRNVRFRESKFMNMTASVLRAEAARRNQGASPRGGARRGLYVVQTGSWDLAYTTFRAAVDSVAGFMSDLGAVHRALTATGAGAVIFATTPPLPNESDHPLRLVSRNNEITAAINKRFRDEAAKQGIEFVDVFNIIFPFYRERAREFGRLSHHYVRGDCQAAPGLVALQTVFYGQCRAHAADHPGPFVL